MWNFSQNKNVSVFYVYEEVLFIIYYWGQHSLKMDSAEIVFAEVQQVIGKTGKYNDL